MNIIKRTQHLPININEAWEFFSKPINLSEITPDYMGFDILSDSKSNEIYPGKVITYRVKPLFGIPLTWVTEIAHIDKPNYFVDIQVAGPYRFWHHQHFFVEKTEGVEMRDLVHYAAPFGWIGKLAELAVVDRKVNEIFDYRREKLKRLIG